MAASRGDKICRLCSQGVIIATDKKNYVWVFRCTCMLGEFACQAYPKWHTSKEYDFSPDYIKNQNLQQKVKETCQEKEKKESSAQKQKSVLSV